VQEEAKIMVGDKKYIEVVLLPISHPIPKSFFTMLTNQQISKYI
jgi:hypothetical protein